jgi:hypothetical protein
MCKDDDVWENVVVIDNVGSRINHRLVALVLWNLELCGWIIDNVFKWQFPNPAIPAWSPTRTPAASRRAMTSTRSSLQLEGKGTVGKVRGMAPTLQKLGIYAGYALSTSIAFAPYKTTRRPPRKIQKWILRRVQSQPDQLQSHVHD